MKRILKAILVVLEYIIVLLIGSILLILAFTLFPYWLFSVLGGGM